MYMRGPSAEAFATLGDQLVAAICRGRPRDAARVGEDLFGLADVLRTSRACAGSSTDASVEAAGARSGLVREHLRGQGRRDLASTCVVTAVGRRWTATRDLPTLLEHLGVGRRRALRRRTPGGSPTSCSRSTSSSSRTPTCAARSSDPARSVDGQARRCCAACSRTRTAAGHRRGWSSSRWPAPTGPCPWRSRSTRRSPRPCTASASPRCGSPASSPTPSSSGSSTALTAQYGRDVHLNVVVDPELIGGIRVEIGDDVIDGTVASRLDDARRRLAG